MCNDFYDKKSLSVRAFGLYPSQGNLWCEKIYIGKTVYFAWGFETQHRLFRDFFRIIELFQDLFSKYFWPHFFLNVFFLEKQDCANIASQLLSSSLTYRHVSIGICKFFSIVVGVHVCGHDLKLNNLKWVLDIG